jgi:CheY-like chemotaxis protein/two-component sensor histidine kinase
LEEANSARNQFLSTMSHELRTPLASIIGFSQLLMDDSTTASLSQQQQGNLERILKNGQHLLSLVSDVLDLEKIEAGGMEITYSQVDIGDLLTSVVEETQSLAITRNLVLRADIGDEVDSLESNPVKLRQILLNLVSNALKFTEQGEVTVSARRGDTDHLVFSVRDTGIGIPEEMQEQIFAPFYQVDGGYTRKTGGTGLGLSIVSRLTTLLGGTIELTSIPDQGSTFTVTLPLKAIRQQIEPAIPRLHARQPQEVSTTSAASAESTPDELSELLETTEAQQNVVLAVDDDPDVLDLIKVALQETSYTIVGVQDPLQVMDLVQKTQPAAITLDVMMPGLNGWQLLHQLRENPATAGIPVVMVTVLPEAITTGYVLGADDFLIKPFKNDVLLTTLQRLIASQQERSRVSKRETQPVAKRYR